MWETIVKIFAPENILFMLRGMRISIIVAICAVLMGIVLGILGAVCKMSRSKLLRIIGNVYVEFIRGTPMLLQLSFFYLGIPMLYQMITGKYLEVNPLLMGILSDAMGTQVGSVIVISVGVVYLAYLDFKFFKNVKA